MENYVLEGSIGSGQYSKVFLAVHNATNIKVAIKFVDKNQDSDHLSLLRSEVLAQRNLKHKNILKLLACFETEREVCLVTELCVTDFLSILQEQKKFSELEIKPIAKGLVEGLSYIHSKCIIHRDMKLQNILLGLDGEVKIADFGFSKKVEEVNGLTTKSIKGTPIYMAPELVKEEEYDHLVDIWALGIILFELYTGHPPFNTTNIFSLVSLILNDSIVWPAHISTEFQDLLQGLLQKKKENRLDWPDLALHSFISDELSADEIDESEMYLEEETSELASNSKDKRLMTTDSGIDLKQKKGETKSEEESDINSLTSDFPVNKQYVVENREFAVNVRVPEEPGDLVDQSLHQRAGTEGSLSPSKKRHSRNSRPDSVQRKVIKPTSVTEEGGTSIPLTFSKSQSQTPPIENTNRYISFSTTEKINEVSSSFFNDEGRHNDRNENFLMKDFFGNQENINWLKFDNNFIKKHQKNFKIFLFENLENFLNLISVDLTSNFNFQILKEEEKNENKFKKLFVVFDVVESILLIFEEEKDDGPTEYTNKEFTEKFLKILTNWSLSLFKGCLDYEALLENGVSGIAPVELENVAEILEKIFFTCLNFFIKLQEFFLNKVNQKGNKLKILIFEDIFMQILFPLLNKMFSVRRLTDLNFFNKLLVLSKSIFLVLKSTKKQDFYIKDILELGTLKVFISNFKAFLNFNFESDNISKVDSKKSIYIQNFLDMLSSLVLNKEESDDEQYNSTLNPFLDSEDILNKDMYVNIYEEFLKNEVKVSVLFQPLFQGDKNLILAKIHQKSFSFLTKFIIVNFNNNLLMDLSSEKTILKNLMEISLSERELKLSKKNSLILIGLLLKYAEVNENKGDLLILQKIETLINLLWNNKQNKIDLFKNIDFGVQCNEEEEESFGGLSIEFGLQFISRIHSNMIKRLILKNVNDIQLFFYRINKVLFTGNECATSEEFKFKIQNTVLIIIFKLFNFNARSTTSMFEENVLRVFLKLILTSKGKLNKPVDIKLFNFNNLKTYLSFLKIFDILVSNFSKQSILDNLSQAQTELSDLSIQSEFLLLFTESYVQLMNKNTLKQLISKEKECFENSNLIGMTLYTFTKIFYVLCSHLVSDGEQNSCVPGLTHSVIMSFQCLSNEYVSLVFGVLTRLLLDCHKRNCGCSLSEVVGLRSGQNSETEIKETSSAAPRKLVSNKFFDNATAEFWKKLISNLCITHQQILPLFEAPEKHHNKNKINNLNFYKLNLLDFLSLLQISKTKDLFNSKFNSSLNFVIDRYILQQVSPQITPRFFEFLNMFDSGIFYHKYLRFFSNLIQSSNQVTLKLMFHIEKFGKRKRSKISRQHTGSGLTEFETKIDLKNVASIFQKNLCNRKTCKTTSDFLNNLFSFKVNVEELDSSLRNVLIDFGNLVFFSPWDVELNFFKQNFFNEGKKLDYMERDLEISKIYFFDSFLNFRNLIGISDGDVNSANINYTSTVDSKLLITNFVNTFNGSFEKLNPEESEIKHLDTELFNEKVELKRIYETLNTADICDADLRKLKQIEWLAT
ncbi:serine/threonine protein kinase [Lobulomyces angularis]|nr:serine/threonine protein kinase [Lobulomyces angularis]